MHIFILNLFFAFFLGSYLQAGEFDLKTTIFQAEKTAHGGTRFSLPSQRHPDFSLSAPTYQIIYQKLLNNPKESHDACLAIQKQAFQFLMNSHKLLIQFAETKNQSDFVTYQESCKKAHADLINLHKQNPIFFMQECTGNGGQCAMTRQEDQTKCPREKVMQGILEKIKATDKPLNLTAYAAGDCFAELELFSRLKNANHKIKNLILIDPAFNSIISDDKLVGSISAKDFFIKLHTPHRKMLYQIMQILYFTGFENPDFHLTVYGDFADYQKDVTNNSALASDIILALDYQDKPDNINDALDKQLDYLFKGNTLKTGGIMARAFSQINEYGNLVPNINLTEKK